jgi:hypothetical protein
LNSFGRSQLQQCGSTAFSKCRPPLDVALRRLGTPPFFLVMNFMGHSTLSTPTKRLPLLPKLLLTAFVAVLVPKYWMDYGPTNFLYFCDVALFMTVGALWLESSLLAAAPLVGILLPQVFWQVDFLAGLCGFHVTGMTDYMFEAQRYSLLTRGLSLFHFWLPLLLLWIVARLGYDRRAEWVWTILALLLMFICYFLMPAPPPPVDHPNLPVNINYVFGLGAEPQQMMPPLAWFAVMVVGLPLVVFLPSHLILCWLFREPERMAARYA